MNEGWKCPECGRCYAPWVSECRECRSLRVFSTPKEPYGRCDHAWPSDTTGTYCMKCGKRSNMGFPNSDVSSDAWYSVGLECTTRI